ncbi:sigma-54 interaction domain-containing protein [Ectobacillus antri]|jgi:transcriptional regulator with PAS, ATPase and Fis domain|uniref:sigma-54 interaction domain-containing protein n=1 Tax=Ectobacillus antri TaxID=2486280 RepID=UPI000F5B0A42|nr:sigma 54-interacting transcriptional regulator [Ectobacillus antri]
MKKSLVLIAGSVKTKEALHHQLKQLLGDYISIDSYAIDEGFVWPLTADVVLYSSEVVKFEANRKRAIETNHSIVGKRTLHHEYIDLLLRIPSGRRVLVVNDDYDAAVELIQSLYRLGIDHIEFFPFKKEQVFYEDIYIAISPGEAHLAPPYMKEVIDIGVRLFDMTTVLEIVKDCGLDESISVIISDRYIRNIIELQRKLMEAEQLTKRVNEHIQNVVDTVDDGILAIDVNEIITVFNKGMEAILRVPMEQAIGQPISRILPQQEIVEFIRTGIEDNKYFNMNGVDSVVFRFPMLQENKIVVTFKSVSQAFEIEKTAQREFRNQGFVAKYSFEDIIGEHASLIACKQVAKKLALSDHPILIQGETGTGKELFAHAIHKQSNRKNGPFVAVNCSAFTESLLESELFGYEEGTFTGAKKGGKKGLFELADNGTIFLDEIGDISLHVQSHLLRVLQEQEIRRVGGRKIIPINVRVIAATNKNIQKKIEDSSFRSDLFYRLNVLGFHIPSLRLRKQDIPLLIRHFISKSGRWISVEEEVMQTMMEHNWPGNIRELKGVLDYMLAVSDGRSVTTKDVPGDRFHSSEQSRALWHTEYNFAKTVLEMREHLCILETIKRCNDAGKAASREYISLQSMEYDAFLSPQQVRLRLTHLQEEGFVVKGKGRAGTKITSAGVDYLRFLKTQQNTTTTI